MLKSLSAKIRKMPEEKRRAAIASLFFFLIGFLAIGLDDSMLSALLDKGYRILDAWWELLILYIFLFIPLFGFFAYTFPKVAKVYMLTENGRVVSCFKKEGNKGYVLCMKYGIKSAISLVLLGYVTGFLVLLANAIVIISFDYISS